MNWTDITSYSRMDAERMPRVFECTLTPYISFKVHKHIHYGEAWLLTAPCVGLDCFELETANLTEAQTNAAAIMSQKLLERQNELNTALALLGHPSHAQWLPNGEFAMCSNCHDLFKERDVTVFDFCPSCGADMRRDTPAAAYNKELED